jgi:hypothetical protein
MANVEIIGLAPSTYVRVARMVCEEKAIPIPLADIRDAATQHKAPYIAGASYSNSFR